MSDLFHKNIILKMSDLLTGNSVHSSFSFLLNSQWWSKEQIIDFQNKHLTNLINHSYRYVPYYKELFDEIGIIPSDVKSTEDLYKLPLLNKDIIRKNGIEKLTSTSLPKKKYILNSSSGSTGEPLFYYNTKEAYSLNIAASLRGWYWMGFRLGDRFAKLSQNPRNSLLKRMQDKFTNNLYLSTNPLTDQNYNHILSEIENYKPDFIRCYPDPLLFITKFRQNNHNVFKHFPKAIATTGNTLFEENRKFIEDEFRCEIFDAYNCEGNSNVFECPTHECYHSAEEYGISEILDENDKLITSGIGRLVSTDLFNTAHPFIRYDTQDLVEIYNSKCSCGRQLLSYKRIIGRDNEILTMPNGQKYISHNFTGFFQTDYPEIKRGVNQFQIIKRKDSIIFKLVVNERFDKVSEFFIKNFWEKELNYTVIIDIVEEIPLTKTGKRRFIVNE